MKNIIFFICLFFITAILHAQPPISWVAIDSTVVFGGIQAKDYNYVLAGSGYDASTGTSLSRMTEKYNCSGQLEWRRFDGHGRLWDLIETPAHEYVMIGDTNGGISCTKFSESGNKIWSAKYPPIGNDHGYSIDNSDDGGFILLGQLTQVGPRIIRIDSLGTSLLDTLYGALGNAISIVSNGNNTFTFLSQTEFGADTLYLDNIDTSGNIIWQKSYYGEGGPGPSGKNLTRTNDFGYAFSGSTLGMVTLYKTDSNGNLQWSKTYCDGVGARVEQTSDNGYLISGQRGATSQNFMLKTDANGDSLWTKSFGTLGSVGNVVFETPDSGILFSAYGRYDTTFALNAYSYQVKYNYGAPCLFTDVNQPSSMEEKSIYPNPFSNSFIINLPTIEQSDILIYDFTGRIVYNCLSAQSQVIIDGSNFSNGLYLVSIMSKNSLFTHKVIKQ